MKKYNATRKLKKAALGLMAKHRMAKLMEAGLSVSVCNGIYTERSPSSSAACSPRAGSIRGQGCPGRVESDFLNMGAFEPRGPAQRDFWGNSGSSCRLNSRSRDRLAGTKGIDN
eukprot:scaffold40385_cov92-Phaeocystis_antarctica.AAC.1